MNEFKPIMNMPTKPAAAMTKGSTMNSDGRTQTTQPAAGAKKKSSKRTFTHPPPRILQYNRADGSQINFIRGEQIGTGGFARCYRVQDSESGKLYACKVVDKVSIVKPKAKSKMRSEIKIHQILKHEFVVRVEYVFESEEFVFIVMELCTNQTLHELLKHYIRLPENEARFYLKQIVHGLQYIHGQSVIHRDLKLGNLMLDEKMHIKIGDFGLAARVDFFGQRKKTICGTPNYIAPEILTRSENGHSYEVDVWSLGVVLYTMVVGKPPFQTKTARTTYRRIRENSYSFPRTPALSSELRSLISAMLCSDPCQRPTLRWILDHAWMQSGPSVPSKRYIYNGPLKSLGETSTAQNALTEIDTAASMEAAVARKEAAKAAAAAAATDANRLCGSKRRAPRRAAAIAAKENIGNVMRSRRASNENTSPEKADKRERPTKLRRRSKGCSDSSTGSQASASVVQPWVHKWIDYSNKYGLAFQLSNGLMGAYFNDHTKIILSADGVHVQYQEKSGDDVVHCSMISYPTRLKKKINLLQFFQKHFVDGVPANSLPGPIHVMKDPEERLPVVTSWRRTHSAMLFDIDHSQTLQVNFFDHSKVFLFPKEKRLRFVDRMHGVHMLALNDQRQVDNPSAQRRLNYLRRVFSARYTDL